MSQYSPIRKRLRTSVRQINNIPDEKSLSILEIPIINLFHIFSFLDANTLLTKVQLVCKYFHSIIKDDALWNSFRCLTFSNNESMIYIITIIKKCKNIKHLKIIREIGKNFDYDKKNLHSCLLDVLAHYPQLRSVSLSNFRIGLNCEESFKFFIKSVPNLTYLDLDKCYICNSIADIISEAKNLKSLCLSRCYSVENQTFIKIFKNCEKLEHLNLSQQDTLNDKVFHAIFTICSENIQTLFLRDISIQHNNFTHIKNCTKLSVLSIDCHFLNDKTLNYIKQLNNLKHLELSYGLLFTAHGLGKFFSEGSLLNLKHLDLTCCAGLENSTLEILSNRCRYLECLDMSECWRVTDKGVFHVIRKCLHLKLLNLEDLKELKGFFLSEIHLYLKELKVLNLSFCDGIIIKNLQQFMNLNPSYQIKKCKEYRVKPKVNLYSPPLLIISQGMFM